MKIKDLLEDLSGLDPEMDVYKSESDYNSHTDEYEILYEKSFYSGKAYIRKKDNFVCYSLPEQDKDLYTEIYLIGF